MQTTLVRLMRIVRVAFAFVLVVAGLARADQVDDLVTAEMKRQNIPGLALVVLKDGQIIKSAGYGVADRERNVPVTPETVFKIGSVSKQFLATAVMLLVKDGRLRLDDPIGTYLPDAPSSWRAITIRHLLTHTAGLVRESPGFDPLQSQRDIDVIRAAYAVPLVFEPGTAWLYSNVGYYAIAEIIHVASGQPWDEFVSVRIFKPAGMLATHTTATAGVPDRATGYTDNNQLRPADDWPALRPSGAFVSTVVDLAKWEAILHTDGIIDDVTRRQMWTRVTLVDGTPQPYGFGWRIESYAGRNAVLHGGGLPGFSANFVRFVDERLTVVILLNTDDADEGSIVARVVNAFAPRNPER